MLYFTKLKSKFKLKSVQKKHEKSLKNSTWNFPQDIWYQVNEYNKTIEQYMKTFIYLPTCMNDDEKGSFHPLFLHLHHPSLSFVAVWIILMRQTSHYIRTKTFISINANPFASWYYFHFLCEKIIKSLWYGC